MARALSLPPWGRWSCTLLLLCLPSLAAARCPSPPTGAPLLRVAYVDDGDTLRLEDGRRVRLLGINAPELAHGGGVSEPFARRARKRLRALVEASGGKVRLRSGIRKRDRYRRHLAYLFDDQGRDLGRELVREGLALMIALPPDDAHVPCYRIAEERARVARRGLWRRPPLRAARLRPPYHGFHLIRGRVSRVGASRRSLWLTLDGVLQLRIARRDLDRFPGIREEAREGRLLEVRGWLHDYDGRPAMRVRHAAMLRWEE